MKDTAKGYKIYEAPELSVTPVFPRDVITTSGGTGGWDLPEIPVTGSVSDLD